MYNNLNHLLTIYILVVCLVVSNNAPLYSAANISQKDTWTDSLDNYIRQVDSLYKDMTFSGAELSLIGVPLVNTTIGIAFAGFNSKTKKRFIKLNYQHLLNQYGELHLRKPYNPKDTATFIVMGILAHEWAHHYMGHTFTKQNPIKERDADILAGRILYENLDEQSNSRSRISKSSLAQKQEKSQKVGIVFIDSINDSYHLKRLERLLIIYKGLKASYMIDQANTISLKDLVGQNKKSSNIVKDSIKNMVNNIDSSKLKLEAIKEKQVENQSKIENLRNLRISDSMRHAPVDSVGFLNLAIGFKKLIIADPGKVQLKARLDSINKLKKDSLEAFKEQKKTEIDLEIYYNFYYINKDSLSLLNKIPEFNSYFSLPNGTGDSLSYDLLGRTRIVIHQSLLTVDYYLDEKKQSISGITLLKSTPDPNFNSTFDIEGSTFYIDNNCHIWTKIIAAKRFIDNKLFLNIFSTPPKKTP